MRRLTDALRLGFDHAPNPIEIPDRAALRNVPLSLFNQPPRDFPRALACPLISRGILNNGGCKRTVLSAVACNPPALTVPAPVSDGRQGRGGVIPVGAAIAAAAVIGAVPPMVGAAAGAAAAPDGDGDDDDANVDGPAPAVKYLQPADLVGPATVFCIDCGYAGHKSARSYTKCPQSASADRYKNGGIWKWGSKAPDNYKATYRPPSSLPGAPNHPAFTASVWEPLEILESHGARPPVCSGDDADKVNPSLGFSSTTTPWELYEYMGGTVDLDGEEMSIWEAQEKWIKVRPPKMLPPMPVQLFTS